jgi:hypothetical protein
MLLTRLGMSAVAVVVMMMLFLDAASADIKIGNKSQFVQSGTNSAGGTTAARAQPKSPSPKATTATRGRPQSLAYKVLRFIISNEKH